VLVNDTGSRLIDPDLSELEEGFGGPVAEVDLADDAYQSENGNILAMRDGEYFVSVSYTPPDAGDVSDVTLELGADILANMS
jgi:hypothetical protein